MKMGRKLLSTVFVLSIFVMCNCPDGYAARVRGVTDARVKVGIMGDLTGPVAAVWIPCANALKDYFRHTNDNGGIHGRKVKPIIEDDRYSIPLALSAFKKLVFRDKVLLLMAASGVGHTHSLIPLSEKNDVPMIAVTNDRRYFEPVRKQIFTPLPFYEDQIELIFEYIFNDLKAKHPIIVLAYPDTAAGNISRDTCRKLRKVYNVKDYSEAVISVGAGDFTSQVLTLKRLKPDYVIIHGYIGSTSAFVRDAYKLKLKSTFIAVQYACVDDTVKLAGVAARGLIGTNAFSSWDDSSPGMAEVREIVMKYNPETKWKNRNFIQGWFAGMLIHRGLEKAGKNLNQETLIQGLEKIRDFDTKGICGIVSYGPDDHKPIDYSRFYKANVDKKQFVPITDWRKPAEKD